MCSSHDECLFRVRPEYLDRVLRQIVTRLTLAVSFLFAALVAALLARSDVALVCGVVALALIYSWQSCRRLAAGIRQGTYDIRVGLSAIHLPRGRTVPYSEIDRIDVRADKQGAPFLAFLRGPRLSASRIGPGVPLDVRRYENGEDMVGLIRQRTDDRDSHLAS